MAIFTELVCLNWFNEGSGIIISEQEFNSAINIVKSILSRRPYINAKYSTIETYNRYKSKSHGKYQSIKICHASINDSTYSKKLDEAWDAIRKKSQNSGFDLYNTAKYESSRVELDIEISKVDDSQTAKIPQDLKNCITKLKELDKKYHDEYKSNCYYKIRYYTQNQIKDDIDTDPAIAAIDIINTNDNKWDSLSRDDFVKEVNSRWKIFDKLYKELKSSFKKIDYDGDKYDAIIYYKTE